MKMKTFYYVKYDETSVSKQETARDICESLEAFISLELLNGRAKSLAITKLEECYMWIGKAIRDEQIDRGGDNKHVPERGE